MIKIKNKIVKSLKFSLLACCLGLGFSQTLHAEDLTVYTGFENDVLVKYKSAFEAKNPDITINFVRDSTGIIMAKLLAEKNNPRADVVWGLYSSSVELLEAEDMLIANEPVGFEKINKKFIDTNTPPFWVGNSVEATLLCINTAEMEKQKLPLPTSWEDLTKPIYQGKIVMPNPASSGVGYSAVNAWLQIFGQEKGWEFMDALHNNIATYVHSGSKPCVQAATGEYPIGIGLDFRGIVMKKQGAPLLLSVPKEGVGFEVNSFAIMKGTKHLEAAKKLGDFAISEEAFKLYAPNYSALARPEFNMPIAELPESFTDKMINVDFAKAGAVRLQVLEEWRKRYDTKSEKK